MVHAVRTKGLTADKFSQFCTEKYAHLPRLGAFNDLVCQQFVESPVARMIADRIGTIEMMDCIEMGACDGLPPAGGK